MADPSGRLPYVSASPAGRSRFGRYLSPPTQQLSPSRSHHQPSSHPPPPTARPRLSMDRTLIPASDEEFDRVLASISQANITEALSPRPGSQQSHHRPSSTDRRSGGGSGGGSGGSSVSGQQQQQHHREPSSLPSPSIQLSPSSPKLEATSSWQQTHPTPSVILTSQYASLPPAPNGGGKRVDSTDLWAAAGETGSTHGVSYGGSSSSNGLGSTPPSAVQPAFELGNFHRSPGPPSESGSYTADGNSGYYTPSYASSYGSYQEDAASGGGSYFDEHFGGRMDFLDIGDDGSHSPGAQSAVRSPHTREEEAAANPAAMANGGLGSDVIRMLQAWGQDVLQQQTQQQHRSPGSDIESQDGPASSPNDASGSSPSHYNGHRSPYNDSMSDAGAGSSSSPIDGGSFAQRLPQLYRPPTRTETTDSTMTVQPHHYAPSFPSSSRPALSIPASPLGQAQAQLGRIDTQLGSAPGTTPSVTSPFEAPGAAAMLFPPLDPRLQGFFRQASPTAREAQLQAPSVQGNSFTGASTSLQQSAALAEALAALNGQRGGQNNGQQQAQQRTGRTGGAMEPPQPMGGNASGLSSMFASGSNGSYARPIPVQSNEQPFGHQGSSFDQAASNSFFTGNGGSGVSASLPADSGLPMWMAPSFNSSVFPPLMTQQSSAFPVYGQPGPSYYMHPDALQFLQQQQIQQFQQQQQSTHGPSLAAGPAMTKTSASPTNDGTGTSTPHRRQPPKRQRSRSDASALPYDFGMSALSSVPTMNPNMLSDLSGGGNTSFFPGQAQQMESPSSSPRSISSLLLPPGSANFIPAFNPLPPSAVLPSGGLGLHPSFGNSPNGSEAGGSQAGDAPSSGPRRPSHTSARSFGAGTPGYGVGLLHPHGTSESDAASGSVGVQRSVSDAGRGRQSHRKVQSVDMTYARPDGTLGVPLASVRSRGSNSGGAEASSSRSPARSPAPRSPARSPTPELRALSSTDNEDDDMVGGSGSSVGSVTKQSVTTKKTAAASQGRRKTAATFVCPIPGCGSTFTRSFNLKGHLRSHTDERPFKCSTCQKGFARAHDCKRHMALHVGYRPHVCLGCDKRFARLDALSRHLKSEAGQECIRGGKMTVPLEGASGDEDGDVSIGEGSDDEGAQTPGAGRKGVLL